MKQNKYGREELEETVKFYLEMRQKEIAGESFVKKNITNIFLQNSQDHGNLMKKNAKYFLCFFFNGKRLGQRSNTYEKCRK